MVKYHLITPNSVFYHCLVSVETSWLLMMQWYSCCSLLLVRVLLELHALQLAVPLSLTHDTYMLQNRPLNHGNTCAVVSAQNTKTAELHRKPV